MYPAPPSVPAFITVSPVNSSLQLGGNQIQLTASLTDTTGAPISATQPFVWTSSNTALLTVNDDGLCETASPDPTQLSLGSKRVDVTVTYPYCNRTTGERISATTQITVTAYPATSIFSPLAPGISGGTPTDDFAYAQNHEGSCGTGGKGWRSVPLPQST
jgi:hypothetical protein